MNDYETYLECLDQLHAMILAGTDLSLEGYAVRRLMERTWPGLNPDERRQAVQREGLLRSIRGWAMNGVPKP